MEKFEVILLEEAEDFIESLDVKTKEKVFYILKKASILNDVALFKKLNDTIWEFRILYQKKQYRLLAFWDKRDKEETLVLCTHGFLKKTDKIPSKEIEKAVYIRKLYFNEEL